MTGNQRDGLRREELDPSLEMADVHRAIVGYDGERFRGGGERMKAVAFADPLHDQSGDRRGGSISEAGEQAVKVRALKVAHWSSDGSEWASPRDRDGRVFEESEAALFTEG